MRMKQSGNDKLVVTHFPLFIGAIVLLPIAMMVYLLATGKIWTMSPASSANDQVFKIVFAVVFSGIWVAIFSFFVKRSHFEFDSSQRQLTWSRRGLFSKKGGVVPFDEIEKARVDIFAGSSGQSSWRPSLITKQGCIPLKPSYTGGGFARRESEKIAGAINALLDESHVGAN